MSALLRVTTAPLFDQTSMHARLEVPHGLTISEIVAAAMPAANDNVRARARVWLATENGVAQIPVERWHRARPKPKAHILIRLIPEGDNLKGILTILVAVAATAFAGWAAPLLATEGTALFGFIKAGITLGATALGGILINLLVPPPPGASKEKPVFAISSLRNTYNPNGPLPRLYGKLRVAPVWGVRPYSEVVGDQLFVRGVALWGLGPLSVPYDTLKIGDTPISKYDEVTVETREGYPGDPPLTIVREQVIEKAVGAELNRPLPRDDKGEIIEGEEPEDKPVSRFSAGDSTRFSIILQMPRGLMFIGSGGEKEPWKVTIRRRYRLNGVGEWVDMPDLVIRGLRETGFFRQYSWDWPERGRYEVELMCLTGEKNSEDTIIQQVVWAAMQSFRPEYPFNFSMPVAMTAIMIRSTAQLQGALDEFNGVPQSVARDWQPSEEEEGEGEWIERATFWPASLAILALTSAANAFPVSDDQIDWPAFADWHEFCVLKSLRYNRNHDFHEKFGETLKAIGAAGRAVIKEVDGKWTVVIDRPRAYPTALINARNASQLKYRKAVFKRPHALRVPFQDETNEHKAGERIVRWPGYEGPIELTEERPMKWCTHPDQVYVETRRFMHETDHRDMGYSCIQAGAVRTAQPGAMVMASRDVLSPDAASARVTAVRGNLISIDAPMTMAADKNYAVSFLSVSEEDALGEFVVRPVATREGTSRALRITGQGDLPKVGDIIHFDEASEETIDLIMLPVERGKDNSSILRFVPAAPIIDELTDADALAIPAWDGRVGEVVSPNYTLTDDDGATLIGDDDIRTVDESAPPPDVPTIVGISSDAEATVMVLLQPGSSPIRTASYGAQHRLVGAPAWSTATADVGDGGVELIGHAIGDNIEIRVQAVSVDDEVSEWGPTVTFRVGSDQDFMPAIASFEATRLPSGLWRYEWTTTELEEWQTPATIAGARLRYRDGAWGAWEDLLPVLVGLATTDPWDTSTPMPDGVYTFGVQLVSTKGAESNPVLIYATAPATTDALLADDDGAIIADDDNNFTSEDA